ncbi:MAG: DNA mismatch endonuclease Vsr [Alphaproteobacteria bacterium]|nr:DNA mismatch endonuclease Vsr [Alphaproteobacteria bacterium]
MVTKTTRSDIMRAVKGQDTKPEMAVRRMVHAMGYRYRLHRKDLPGKPDLVFASRKKIIFVHGCFWHGHDCARGARVPKSNRHYWEAKIMGNKDRDKKSEKALSKDGWDVFTVWECELKDHQAVSENIEAFLKA